MLLIVPNSSISVLQNGQLCVDDSICTPHTVQHLWPHVIKNEGFLYVIADNTVVFWYLEHHLQKLMKQDLKSYSYLNYTIYPPLISAGGGRMVRWCWVNFQCRGVLQFGYSRARAYCVRSRCGWGCLDIFTFSPLSPSLWETARYRLKYCLKGPLNQKQPTNQLISASALVAYYLL